MKVKVYSLNAFAKTPTGGNPAGVVLEADSLSDQNKQAIAKKVGFSETAFVQNSNRGNYKVQFFTPHNEVALCGHATVATFSLLFKRGIIQKGDFLQETKAGMLKILVTDSGLVFMNQPLPRFLEIIDKDEIATGLKISAQEMAADLPAQVVTTGGMDVMIPMKNLSQVLSLKPDLKEVEKISRKHQLEGFCVFTLDTKYGAQAHSRSFAPAVGIPEDPACGVQAGALSCYLYQYGLVSAQEAQSLVMEQGYAMNKPSEIFTSLTIKDDKIIAVQVGGTGQNINELELEI